MGLFCNKPFCFITLTLVLLTSFGFIPSCKTSQDYTTLVYKGCASQTFPDSSGLSSQTLAALFDSLTNQASKNKFFKASSGGGQSSISGLFQCRGDLSNGDCYNCVSKIPEMSTKLCGKTIAGRIQLVGCYGSYEVAGFPQISGVKLLYKTCSGSEVAGSGFEERRDTAFSSVVSGIGGSVGGFYATSYESMYVLGQCEGSLSKGDCSECVKAAVQNAQVECGGSVSGQIYLHKCYVSYTYYPNGVPDHKSPSGGGGGGGGGGPGQNPGKTIAIVVGGTAAVGFLIILLLFLRSLMKKHDDY